jgi:hypothetical protein
VHYRYVALIERVFRRTELETRTGKRIKRKIKSKKKEIVRIWRVKGCKCEKGSGKHKKDNGQLKKKDKRRPHCGNENPGTQDTRGEEAVVHDHNLTDHPVYSDVLASVPKSVAI